MNRRVLGNVLAWAGYAWIVLMVGLHYLGELRFVGDPIAGMTLPIRFFGTLLLALPGFVLAAYGRHLRQK